MGAFTCYGESHHVPVAMHVVHPSPRGLDLLRFVLHGQRRSTIESRRAESGRMESFGWGQIMGILHKDGGKDGVSGKSVIVKW